MSKPIECPLCGGEAMIRKSIWFYVQCTACPLELGASYDADGNPEGEYATREEAAEAWNTRVAVTDYDFAMAVHDGELWGKCSECKERQGYYLDAETIQRQQKRIAELERERGEWQFKFCKEAGLHVSDVFMRDELIRDMAHELRYLNDGGISTDCMEHEARMREMGIEAR